MGARRRPGAAPVRLGRWSKAGSPRPNSSAHRRRGRRDPWNPPGADRDDDGSIIALRSTVNRTGRRGRTGGRSVPAKTLTTFNGTAHLHGQNDQLRLMRSDEQRAALDRFASAAPGTSATRSCATNGSSRDAISPTASTAPGDGPGGRPAERSRSPRSTPPIRHRGDEALVADIRQLSELRRGSRGAASARAASLRCGRRCWRR